MTKASDLGILPSNPDNSPALQAALNAGVRLIELEADDYTFLSTVIIPADRLLTLRGAGFELTRFRIGGVTGKKLFEHLRLPGQGASIVKFEQLVFIWTGTPMAPGSKAIDFRAQDYNHSWLRVTECVFYGFEVDVFVEQTGMCHFKGNFHYQGKYAYVLRRGASFVWMTDVHSFNRTFIHAWDDANDAYSNSLFITNCTSVTAGAEDVVVRGWQAVYITGSGFDLGSGGAAAVWILDSQDFRMNQSFVSSNGSTTRAGVLLTRTHTWNITDTTVHNSRVGIQVHGPKAGGDIVRVTFDGHATNDIILLDGARDVLIDATRHLKQMSRIGTDYEIFANAQGVDYITVRGARMAGAPYQIVAGPNSTVEGVKFGVPA